MKQLIVEKNILSQNLYEDLIKFIKHISNNKKLNFFASTSFWDKELIKQSTPVLVYNFSADDVEIYKNIQNEITSKFDYNIHSMIIHIWTPLSYIAWHKDSGYSGGLTIYLNEFWDENSGGYFMYKENEEIKAIKPEKNLGVLQLGGVEHCVSTTNINSDLRYTLQIFFQKDKKML